MGLFNKRPADAGVRATQSSTRRDARWVWSGESIAIGGRAITLGAVYVGTGLLDTHGYDSEPALIDPTLAVDWNSPDWTGESMGYWPRYSEITPQSRAAYLSWLANGRSQHDAYIGYVFLYFYGLERRLLVDLGGDPTHAEADWIASDVRRLLEIYGSNRSFRQYASSFLELIEIVSARTAVLSAPDWTTLPDTWEVPAILRVGLSRYAVANQPIPPEWALALTRTHPDVYLRTPATRCAGEFDELFRRRYVEKFGSGMVVKPNKTPITVTYRPASAGVGSRSHVLDGLPDITALKTPVNQMKVIAEACTDDLDAYSRFLGRTPEGAGTAAATAFLPDELLDTHGGEAFASLRSWSEKVRSVSPVVCSIEDAVQVWAPGRTEKLTKRDASSLAATLAKVRIGVEPDVRFGGKTPAPASKVVLFDLPEGAPSAPSSQYAAAALLVHLTAVVAGADGTVDENERAVLAQHLETTLDLDAAERTRLETSLHWLTLNGPAGLTGVKRRLEALGADQRAAVGDFLVGVAAADGVVSPEEITTLTKVFKLLGLQPTDVYTAVHHLGVVESAPVTVRRADTSEPRWDIPSQPAPTGPVQLDPAKVRARLAETATVAALLTSIFTEDEDAISTGADTSIPPPPPRNVPAQTWSAPAEPGPSPVAEPTIGVFGLDAAHSELAMTAAKRTSWNRSEFDQLAEDFGLLPAGAIDRINDAVMDLVDDLLIEGDDPLEINHDALKELLA